MESPQKKTLREVFAHHVPLVVPRYQRSYAWQDEEVNDFIADMTRLAERRQTSSQRLETDEDHFFGGIVTVREDDPRSQSTVRWELVDGQQRFATVTLAARLIADAYARMGQVSAESRNPADQELARRASVAAERVQEDVLQHTHRDPLEGTRSTRARLSLSDGDREFFDQIVLSREDPSPSTVSQKRLVKAYRLLRRKLVGPVLTHPRLGDQERFELLLALEEAILDRSFVVHIFTTNRAEAYRLFSILNDRGRDLSDADLLRTRTLELTQDYPDIQAVVSKAWESVLNHTPSEIDNFLRAFYASRVGLRAASRGLFDNFSREFFPASIATRDQAESVRDLVRNLSDVSRFFFDIADSVWPYDESAVPVWGQKRLERLIRVMGRSGDIPFLLAVRESRDEEFFAKIVNQLERLAFRYAVGRGHSGYFSEALYREAARVRTQPDYDLPELESSIGALVAVRSPDSAFRASLAEYLRYIPTSSKNNLRVKHALTTIDDYWIAFERAQLGETVGPPNMTAPYDLDQIQVEHIYPQSPQIGEADMHLTELVHDLGNLAFWQGAENAMASNKPYESKRRDLGRARARLTQEAAAYDEWSAEVVRNRREHLVNRLVWIYSLSPDAQTAAGLARRKSWLVYHELDERQQSYLDVRGESYHYPRGIPNGRRINVGDLLVPFCRTDDENMIFGLGIVGEVVELDEDHRVAYYSRYLDLEPIAFARLGREPRTNRRNAINVLDPDLVDVIVPQGVDLDRLPEVESVVEFLEADQ